MGYCMFKETAIPCLTFTLQLLCNLHKPLNKYTHLKAAKGARDEASKRKGQQHYNQITGGEKQLLHIEGIKKGLH